MKTVQVHLIIWTTLVGSRLHWANSKFEKIVHLKRDQVSGQFLLYRVSQKK